MIPFSVLDLSPITAGASATQAFANTLDLAQHAEQWGYTALLARRASQHDRHCQRRDFSGDRPCRRRDVKTIRDWLGWRHAAQSRAAGDRRAVRHARVALPGAHRSRRLGRAPGTDQTTSRALRRDLSGSADSFPDDVVELQRYFADPVPGQRVRAVPGAGLHVPLWLLGSSLFSAQLAAALGLPFAFASHFAPDHMLTALRLYRAQFRPSAALDKPYAMVGVNLFAADTTEAAYRLFTSLQQQFVNLRRGTPGQLQPPVDRIEAAEMELNSVAQSLACSVIGDPDTVREGLLSVIEQTGADELILTAQIYDHAARLRSFEIAAQVRDEIAGAQ
jgi:alkanesulfonate monooxygenase SsuD/methylene tetrahydromethanopterin reductase-like flavin-dependent oxidoreductase (luciferase family)